MARYDVPPTKSSLFAVREQGVIAREGFELLEQKREILVMELMRMVEEVKLLEREMDKRLSSAYGSLRQMLVLMGRETARDVSAGIQFDYAAREKYGKLVSRMAEIRTMVWRLAKEVKKTQRRVNALEKIVIPDVDETRKFIEGVLEEREREVFFVQKILKAKLLGERV